MTVSLSLGAHGGELSVSLGAVAVGTVAAVGRCLPRMLSTDRTSSQFAATSYHEKTGRGFEFNGEYGNSIGSTLDQSRLEKLQGKSFFGADNNWHDVLTFLTPNALL